MTKSHVFFAFLALLLAVIILALAPGNGDIGGRLGLLDALVGLLLVAGGAVFGTQVPKG